jgi:DNA invertase Pin-like site-specific DNA recombinase
MYDHFALSSHLQSLGISLRSATEPIDDTSTGKLMEGVLAAFAQFDNDVRSDRTRAVMKAALELGRWVFWPHSGLRRALSAARRRPLGPGLPRTATAVPTTVLSRRNRVRRNSLCSNRRNRTGFQLLAGN